MGRAAKVQSFFESAMTGFTEQLQKKHPLDASMGADVGAQVGAGIG